ncbi:Major facilitator superfamily [Streptomyces venezuelae]|uniref:hypothetical protein n=1 Tax=Streptomyces gardneri TaxID=66892 RepID=UPI0006BC7FF8|nr:hypothetical protein [Streptomyces gardneri]ALO11138.1 Major facilitator superfamily [Streptomyces venezuelae]QPK48071.1 hypothetical protein H4W23_27825 [Streptomyces gardneri]WRK39528.1 hypothetical protein U0M97_27950 [Streptomyces venezuelae]CUM38353.1 hypothetical protein BN2537_5671 [Streptomyces venezuelae]
MTTPPAPVLCGALALLASLQLLLITDTAVVDVALPPVGALAALAALISVHLRLPEPAPVPEDPRVPDLR